MQLDRRAEPDLNGLVRTSDLPRVLATQPVVGLFVLPAVLDRLLEHAVFVAQPITHSRKLHRCHRVEEARRQTPEPAVSQAGIGFLLEQR